MTEENVRLSQFIIGRNSKVIHSHLQSYLPFVALRQNGTQNSMTVVSNSAVARTYVHVPLRYLTFVVTN